MASVHIITERLILRDLELSDGDRMFQMDADPLVAEAIGMSPTAQIEDTLTYIGLIRDQYSKYGFGRWGVVEKASGDMIGWAGLKLEKNVNNHESFVDLGYRFIPSYWNKGYASEACRALVSYGFNILKLDKICAYVEAANRGSQRVAEKAGLKEVCRFQGERMEEAWLEITRNEYEANPYDREGIEFPSKHCVSSVECPETVFSVVSTACMQPDQLPFTTAPTTQQESSQPTNPQQDCSSSFPVADAAASRGGKKGFCDESNMSNMIVDTMESQLKTCACQEKLKQWWFNALRALSVEDLQTVLRFWLSVADTDARLLPGESASLERIKSTELHLATDVSMNAQSLPNVHGGYYYSRADLEIPPWDSYEEVVEGLAFLITVLNQSEQDGY